MGSDRQVRVGGVCKPLWQGPWMRAGCQIIGSLWTDEVHLEVNLKMSRRYTEKK